MVFLGGALAVVQSASAFQINFASIAAATGANKSGGQLQFCGATASTAATVSFLNAGSANPTAPGYQFLISSVDGGNGVGSAAGDVGKVSGSFAVTQYSATTNAAANNTAWWDTAHTKPKKVVVTESITVSGAGTLTIKDHNGNLLSGTATLNNLTDTFTANASSAGVLSSIAYTSTGVTGSGAPTTSGYQLNITGITYSGTEQDLISLASGDRPGPLGNGRAQLIYTWQTPPVGGSLLALTKLGAGIHKENFTGNISSDAHKIPDGGMTLVILGMSISGVALLRRSIPA